MSNTIEAKEFNARQKRLYVGSRTWCFEKTTEYRFKQVFGNLFLRDATGFQLDTKQIIAAFTGPT